MKQKTGDETTTCMAKEGTWMFLGGETYFRLPMIPVLARVREGSNLQLCVAMDGIDGPPRSARVVAKTRQAILVIMSRIALPGQIQEGDTIEVAITNMESVTPRATCIRFLPGPMED